MRREEVAERAGIGVDWYVRLEQGRAVCPSDTTIDSLARALLLSKAEHAHLRKLGRHSGQGRFSRETVPASLCRLLQNLPSPAYITGRRWDVLAWNAPAADYLVDFGQLQVQDRNILFQMLTEPALKTTFGKEWASEARRMLARFRITYDLWAGDPAFEDLLQRLQSGCPEFPGWWTTHDVFAGPGARKLLHHPRNGTVAFETFSFQATANTALKLTMFTPA